MFLCFFLKILLIYLGEGAGRGAEEEGETLLSKLHAQGRAQQGA